MSGLGVVDPGWQSNGNDVTQPDTERQIGPAIVSDGNGGAIVASYEERTFYPDFGILAQHLLPTGALDPLWSSYGKLVRYGNNWGYTRIVSDGAGGGIVTWTDFTGFPLGEIYAQRVSTQYPGWQEA